MRIVKRLLPLLALASLCVATGACRALLKEVFETPKVRLVRVGFASNPFTAPKGPIEAVLHLQVTNPNSYGLTVSGVRYAAAIGTVTVAEGERNEETRIGPSGETMVMVPVTLRSEAFSSALRQVLEGDIYVPACLGDGQGGLRPGDVIIKVDGHEVTSLPLSQVVGRILGPAGTLGHHLGVGLGARAGPLLARLLASQPVRLVLPPRLLRCGDAVEPDGAPNQVAVAHVPLVLAAEAVERKLARSLDGERFGLAEDVVVKPAPGLVAPAARVPVLP